MTFTLGVVAHVDRQDQIDRLSRELHPDVIEVDDGTLGCGGNHLLTLQSLERSARATGDEWVVVLEDDAVPVPPFDSIASRMLEVAPTMLVSFYLGTGYPAQFQHRLLEATRQDVRWIKHGWMRHAVGYAVHTSLLSGLITHITPLIRDRWAPDDAISASALRQGILVGYTNPSLVDHQDGPSVVTQRTHLGRHVYGGRRRERRAMSYGWPRTVDDKAVTV